MSYWIIFNYFLVENAIITRGPALLPHGWLGRRWNPSRRTQEFWIWRAAGQGGELAWWCWVSGHHGDVNECDRLFPVKDLLRSGWRWRVVSLLSGWATPLFMELLPSSAGSSKVRWRCGPDTRDDGGTMTLFLPELCGVVVLANAVLQRHHFCTDWFSARIGWGIAGESLDGMLPVGRRRATSLALLPSLEML